MNSLLSKYALHAAAFVFLLQSSTPTPVIVELKRSDGTTIVGIVKDKQHFLDCHEHEIAMQRGDKIASTDRTCKDEVDPKNCRMCVYYPSGLGTTGKTPAGALNQVYMGKPAAAPMGESKPNSEVQSTTPNADKPDEQKKQTPPASTGKLKTASKKKSAEKVENDDKRPPI
jgi:hypothetical protein